MFNIEDYNYDLPEELIAQVPSPNRDGSRLLFVKHLESSLSDHHFIDLPRLLKPGDLLVVNNTRVVPARLFGSKETGGGIEILVLEHHITDASRTNTRWCLSKSAKRPKKGNRLFFENGFTGQVEDIADNGLIKIAFQGALSIDLFMDEKGYMPLPPYIKRERVDKLSSLDRERYQTVFSREKGAVASPTAGLHFSQRLIEALNHSGIQLVEITLHVGYGTFKPVRTEDIRQHNLGEEFYFIDTPTADAINWAKREKRRVIAVGTTVVRALETATGPEGLISPGEGKTDLLITPGFRFKVIDGIVTNFHLPKSSLLFLVSAFAGLGLIREVYRWAIEKRYRFYSYGDAMLII
ncbi:MAG: tRNA preQ1(34) S-adenosylmethionine ribosyltransferase-isomerase QueA [Pseudomonadota bacterium]